MKNFTILVGKSASGKDYIYSKLIKEFDFKKVTSITDRPIRENEKQGREYFFVTKEEMDELVYNNKLTEYREYNTYVNQKADVWRYGTPLLDNKNNYLMILDIVGAKKIIELYGEDNCQIFYIHCDDEIRLERAKKRGSFDKSEWCRRLKDDNEKFDFNKLNIVCKNCYFIDNNEDNNSGYNNIVNIISLHN